MNRVSNNKNIELSISLIIFDLDGVLVKAKEIFLKNHE